MKETNTFITPTLETERLKLEPISIKFCSNKYVNWLNDPEIYQYLDNGGNYTYNSLFVTRIYNLTITPQYYYNINDIDIIIISTY